MKRRKFLTRLGMIAGASIIPKSILEGAENDKINIEPEEQPGNDIQEAANLNAHYCATAVFLM